jgi:FkbM family methyltransferase
MLHKALTILRILRDSPAPWRILRQRWRYNLLFMRLAVGRKGWFAYRAWQETPFLTCADDPATFFIYTDGHPDTAELSTLANWLLPGDLCLDLGANIGFFSAVMAERVGPTGQVIAVEGASTTFENLRLTISRLGLDHVKPVHACVGSRAGTSTFYIARNPNDSSLQGVHADPSRPDDFQTVTVPMERADAITASIAPDQPVALVKMDVEGSELAALEGCAGLLQAHDPPLFDVEINPGALTRNGGSVERLLAFFPPDKFDLHFISYSHGEHAWPRNRMIRLPDREGLGFPNLGNLIAVPRLGCFAARKAGLSASARLEDLPS